MCGRIAVAEGDPPIGGAPRVVRAVAAGLGLAAAIVLALVGLG